jgi:hypothetical protein
LLVQGESGNRAHWRVCRVDWREEYASCERDDGDRVTYMSKTDKLVFGALGAAGLFAAWKTYEKWKTVNSSVSVSVGTPTVLRRSGTITGVTFGTPTIG